MSKTQQREHKPVYDYRDYDIRQGKNGIWYGEIFSVVTGKTQVYVAMRDQQQCKSTCEALCNAQVWSEARPEGMRTIVSTVDNNC